MSRRRTSAAVLFPATGMAVIAATAVLALTSVDDDHSRTPQSVSDTPIFYEENGGNDSDSPFLPEPVKPRTCEKPKGPCFPVTPLPQD